MSRARGRAPNRDVSEQNPRVLSRLPLEPASLPLRRPVHSQPAHPKRPLMFIRILLLVSAAQLTACATPSMPDVDKTSSPKPAAAPASEPAARPSALSYGSVTSHVEKNKTTQTDLVEAFGGPNISSVDTDGTEVWVYERSVTQSDVSTQSKDYLGAVNLGVSFGYPHFGASAGASGSAE